MLSEWSQDPLRPVRWDPAAKPGPADWSGSHQPLADPQDRHIAGLGSDREAELAAHLQHRLVVAEHLADEFTDAALPGDRDQARHQQPSETASLPVAANRDGIFRLLPVA